MRVFDLFSIAFRNVSRGKSRVTLSVLSVTVGISAVILLTSLGQTAKATVVEKLGGFGIDGVMVFAGDYDGLTLEDGDTISACVAEVEAAMPFEFWFGYYSVHSGYQNACLMIGTDETVGDYLDMELLSGRLYSSGDCESGERVCIVDSELAVSQFGHTSIEGETLYLIADGRSLEFTIVGVCASSTESTASLLGLDIPPFIYVPWTSMGYDETSDLGQLALRLSDNADSSKVSENVSNLLKSTNTNGRLFDVEDMTVYQGSFANIIDTVTGLLAATAAISLAVAGLGVMNSMLAGVNERKSEIGVCKAIGATSRDICAIYLFEAAIISGVGCIVGACVGICAACTVFLLVFDRMPDISAASVVVPCAVTVAAGVISGVIPAVKAAALRPITAIRKD